MGSTVDTGYFSQVQEQFSLRVSESLKGVAAGYESLAKAGVSAPVNAFDSMVKGGMALASMDGGTWSFAYDDKGNVIERSNPKGVKQRRSYDHLGRIVEVEDFDGNHIKLEYDGIDNLILYQDDLQRVEYAYEGMWKLVRRRDERGQLGFVYDSEERLLRVSNENWEHYHFDLDDAGVVIGERDFDRGYRSYQRDRAGRVIRETLPSGKFKEYEYDKCGRVTRITHDYDKVEEQTYSYYSSGRL